MGALQAVQARARMKNTMPFHSKNCAMNHLFRFLEVWAKPRGGHRLFRALRRAVVPAAGTLPGSLAVAGDHHRRGLEGAGICHALCRKWQLGGQGDCGGPGFSTSTWLAARRASEDRLGRARHLRLTAGGEGGRTPRETKVWRAAVRAECPRPTRNARPAAGKPPASSPSPADDMKGLLMQYGNSSVRPHGEYRQPVLRSCLWRRSCC